MNTFNTEASIGELVAENIERSRIFEKLGLDYCCGGKNSLKQACHERGLDLQQVIDMLETGHAETSLDIRKLTLAQLADHIEQTHHMFLRNELPRISRLTSKVVAAHAANHPEVLELQAVYETLREELEAHMLKEERILFPYIRELDARPGERVEFHCGSVQAPISQMEHEHEAAGDMLERMRTLTQNYTVPSDVCATYRAMLSAIEGLEKDLHMHIHKENNVLFPGAVRMEQGQC